MDKYGVTLISYAYRDLDEIYTYIAAQLHAVKPALNLIDKLEEAILSLEVMLHRGAKRRTGSYANKAYRQLFVDNFTIIYRIEEVKKQVIIVTVRYSGRDF